MGRLAGAAIGALFFLWIAGTRALDPGEIGWLMRWDWPIYFFSWHFFRGEPWHWPPGLITSYYAPIGTSIGFTDAVPLAAFALKPFSRWLPATFQYIGLWLLACFALQGWFGAWLVSRWSPRASLQACGAALFVMMPTLLIRIGHPALCSHWLLLWVLVVATREGGDRARRVEWAGLGAVAGLLQPYLAVMALALLVAIATSPSVVSLARRMAALGAALLGAVAAWWAAGFFTLQGAGSFEAEGLGHYSMNLLGPFTHAGWSTILPDLPHATTGQAFEGFHYLGLGVLVLIALAAACRLWVGPQQGPPSPAESRRRFPPALFVMAVALALVALSPRVTVGSVLLLDLSGPWTAWLAMFRSTGRFFWPLGYLLLAWALAVIVTRLPPRLSTAVLLAVIAVQAVDLHGAHEERRRGARDPEFYAWANPMASPVWHQILPHYRHLVLYPPPQCGNAPVGYEGPAYLAGLHGLTLNAGSVARRDDAQRLRYCHDLGDRVKAGQIDEETLYVVPPSEADEIRRVSQPPVVCGVVSRLTVCVSAGSYQRWRDVVRLN